jgi:Rps23 Pro-64 3,4-dihydroxylase Tpa1-like proline 4-hydroxylase
MIKTFDNIFPTAYQEWLYQFATNSLYIIGSQDGPATLDRRTHIYMHSEWSEQDLANSQFREYLGESAAGAAIGNKRVTRATINLSVPSDTNFSHTHLDQLVGVYYLNLDWKPEWAGETLFYNDDMSDIIHATMYKPNRFVLFDGSIPHTIRPQAFSAPHYRLTLAIFFS